MKALKLMSVCGLAATLLCGCGDGGEGKRSARGASSEPRIARGSAFAVGMAAPGGRLKEIVQPIQKSFLAMLPESSQKDLEFIDFDKDIHWVLLTSPSFEFTDGEIEKVPDAALVLAVDHDFAKIKSLLEKIRGRDCFVETEVSGVPALKLPEGELPQKLDRTGLDPVFASLDGKLLILTTTVSAMKRQIALYRDGEGQSDEFPGFKLDDENLFCAQIPKAGRFFTELYGRKLARMLRSCEESFPNAPEIVPQLGAVKLSALVGGDGSVTLDFAAEMSNAAAASLLKVELGVLQAKLGMQRCFCDDGADLLKLLETAEVESQGRTLTAKTTIPADLIRKYAQQFCGKVESERSEMQSSACRMNLRQIESAYEMAGMVGAKPKTLDDLCGEDKFLRSKPVCPCGGKYDLNGGKPTCSCGQSLRDLK